MCPYRFPKSALGLCAAAALAAVQAAATPMQRARNRELWGSLPLVPKACSSFGSGHSGAIHGTPCEYDTQVRLYCA